MNFVPVIPEEQALKVLVANGGPAAIIGDNERPLVTKPFTAKLIQPGHINSADAETKAKLKDHIAKFYIEGLDEAYSTLRLMPINMISRSRRLWGEFSTNQDKSLLCYSMDGENPSPNVAQPMCDKCGEFKMGSKGEYFVSDCEKAQWKDGQKPECAELIRVAFLELEYLVPIEMQFKGTQLSAWYKFRRDYETAWNRARLKGENINDFVINMTAANEGTWASMALNFVNAADENPAQYVPLIDYYWKELFEPQRRAEEEALKNQMQDDITEDPSSVVDLNTEDMEDAGEEFSLDD